MPKKYITVSPEMDKLVQREADKRGAPYAAIIREAIELWAKKKGHDIEDTVTWGGARKDKPSEPGQYEGVPAR